MRSRLLIDEPPLLVIPGLAKVVGLDGAIVLQQVHYLTNPDFSQNHFQDRYWVWKTYEQWAEILPFWSKRTIQRVIRALEESNLLVTYKKQNKSFKNVKYYAINYDELTQMIQGHCSSSKWSKESQIDEAFSSPNEGLNRTGNGGMTPHGHFDPIDRTKSDHGDGQVGHEQVDNLATPYKDKITGKETLPLQRSPSEKIDEEEEEDLSRTKIHIVAESMIALWNKFVQSKLNGKTVVLGRQDCFQLNQLLRDSFNDDLAQWKAYCDQIAQCQFLMTRQESGFQVHFHWAITPQNISKVLNGAYYDKPQESPLPTEKDEEAFLQSLQLKCASESSKPQWFEICKGIVKTLGQASFESWFLNVVPEKLEEEEVVLTFPHEFSADHVKNTYGREIQGILKTVFPKLKSYDLEVP